MDRSTPGLPVHHQLPEFTQTHVHWIMPSNHLNLCCPLLLPRSIFPSTRVFSNESVVHIRWPKYWSFSFSISPSNEYSELISFRIDWFAVLEVQFSSVTQLCPTLCDPMDCSMPGLPVHHQLPEFTHISIKSVMPSNHLNLCCPLLLLSSIFPSIRVFSSESVLCISCQSIGVSTSASVLPMNTQD